MPAGCPAGVGERGSGAEVGCENVARAAAWLGQVDVDVIRTHIVSLALHAYPREVRDARRAEMRDTVLALSGL